MHLKTLTLKGFKSFAQPTTFAFEKGVTAVVGPNGSGKSNVVDALAWVMGEQGAKTLRGGAMSDVIFAGTATRGPLGRAEVILTIDNADGALPIDYSEVTISRTLFRGGGSEYAINGVSVRLLDVQELLSDSGLGREMHVIVGQGQLDQVLRASAEERRGFIEEAAGILKHRRRKEKTLRKLEAMQANFTRLNDLAGELRRQLKPLGKQAEVAREAASVAAAARDAKARLIADELVSLRAALAAFGRDEQARHAERIVLQEQVEQKRLRIARIEAEQVGDAVDRARALAFGLEQVQERLRGLHTLTAQRIALLGADASDLPVVVGVTQAAIDEARSLAEELRVAVAAAEGLLGVAQGATRDARARLDAVDDEIAAQSALLSEHDLELSRLSGAADAAATRVGALRAEVERQRAQLAAAGERRTAAESALADSEPVAGGGDSAAELAEEYDLAQAAVFEAESALETTRESLHALERERDALAARVNALSQALDAKDGSAALIASGRTGMKGRVADSLRVKEGYQAAIAAALGTLADAVLVEDRDAALDLAEFAASEDLGSVELVVLGTPTGGLPSAVMTQPKDAVSAVEVLVESPSSVRALLGQTLIVDDLAAARRLWPGSGGSGITLVTKAGEVLSEFLLRGGSQPKQSRLELVADRDAAAERAAEVGAALGAAESALAEHRAAGRAARERSTAALASLRGNDARLAEHTERLSRLQAQVESAAAEAERLGTALTESQSALAAAERVAAQAVAALETARSAPRPILDVSSRDQLAAELDAAREAEIEARLGVETARERVRAEIRRAEQLAARHRAEQSAAEEAARRAVLRRHQLEAAGRVAEALPAVLDSVDRSLAEARSALTLAEAARAGRNDELLKLRREESEVRERLQALSEDVHGIELQIYERRLHLSGLLERAAADLALDEDVLVAEYGPEVPVPADGEGREPYPFDRAEQQRRFEKADRALQQLGRVNPLALEEFAALEQRHAFLTEQLVDLEQTRRDLLTIIDELDQTMLAVFRSAFEDTQAAFGEIFPLLFPGGTGSIALTNPDDLLTSGVEVTVRPAGKRIERLSLLSGGERSLAAVALLVAIFTARPSPFYILDEVEAALDDANLGRLLAVFERLSENSQLIVVTHQKRTMEIADALYGVSMRQDGVSAVVGQRVAVGQA